jgi:hypothetical protein
MTREGAHPLTPLTTEQMEALIRAINNQAYYRSDMSQDNLTSIKHAIAELIDIRHQLQRIATACPDKDTANALIKLMGADA